MYEALFGTRGVGAGAASTHQRPPPQAVYVAAGALYDTLNTNGCIVVPFQTCRTFQAAYNTWGTGIQIAVDGEYGPCTHAALAAVFNQGQGLTAPPSCFAGSCVNGKYVAPAVFDRANVLPSKYRVVGAGAASTTTNAKATLAELATANCNGSWVPFVEPKVAVPNQDIHNIWHGVVPASAVPAAWWQGGEGPPVPSVSLLNVDLWRWGSVVRAVATQYFASTNPNNVRQMVGDAVFDVQCDPKIDLKPITPGRAGQGFEQPAPGSNIPVPG